MITWLGDDGCDDATLVGAKAANLSRLASAHPVPPGFALSASGAALAMQTGLEEMLADLRAAYDRLCAECGGSDSPVAVRSSAIDEDGPVASFAGQHQTLLNVRGFDALVDATVRCVVSARAAEAVAYRQQRGLSVEDVRIAVLVQSLVVADSAGVAFTTNPLTGRDDEVLINANWGLGESVVGGTVTPDMFVVNKASWAVTATVPGDKTTMTVLGEAGTHEAPVPHAASRALTSVQQVVRAAHLAVSLEEAMGWPADVEFAFAGDALYLLQCRPITAGVHP